MVKKGIQGDTARNSHFSSKRDMSPMSKSGRISQLFHSFSSSSFLLGETWKRNMFLSFGKVLGKTGSLGNAFLGGGVSFFFPLHIEKYHHLLLCPMEARVSQLDECQPVPSPPRAFPTPKSHSHEHLQSCCYFPSSDAGCPGFSMSANPSSSLQTASPLSSSRRHQGLARRNLM